MNDLLEGAKVWQKDWIRQIRADLEEHGLKTKCDQILKRLLSSKGRNQFNVLMKTVVECFIAKKKKEMYRHLRDNHSEPSFQTSASEI